MSSLEKKSDWIDGALYPEQPVPVQITSLSEQMDFIVRVCAAWDFGLPPRSNTMYEILQNRWKKAVDETQLLTSCAYHVLRERHQLEPLPYLGQPFPEILNDPFLQYV